MCWKLRNGAAVCPSGLRSASADVRRVICVPHASRACPAPHWAIYKSLPAQHALQQCAVNRLPAGAGQVEQVVVNLAGGFAERR